MYLKLLKEQDSLNINPDPKLKEYVDSVILKIAAAQEDDGYLYYK